MSISGFDSASDLVAFVKGMASALADRQFGQSAEDLAEWAEGSWITGSEFLGELGLRCRRIIERDGERLPLNLRDDIERCLKLCRTAFSPPDS